jgi:iron complex outermembrane receptor protein
MSELTKSFGAIGQIMPGLYAFASYNTTFQFSNSYTAVYTSTGLPVPGDGVPVSPETGKGYEFGFKSALFHDKLSGTISWFSVERNGVSAPDYIRFTTDPRNLTGDFVRFNTNGGLQRSRGIDGDLVWSPTSALQVLANFTYISEARILSDPSINTSNVGITEANARQYDKEFKHRLSKSPKFSGNLVAKYNFTDGSLKGAFVGGGVRHTGLYSISDAFNYDIYVKAETKFDAFAGYRTRVYGVPTTVQVNLTNIGNKINDVTRDDGFVAQLRVSLQF